MVIFVVVVVVFVAVVFVAAAVVIVVVEMESSVFRLTDPARLFWLSMTIDDASSSLV